MTECEATKYVTETNLSVRDNWNADANKVSSATYRDSLTVIATIKDSNWVKVRLADGVEGYVWGDYLSDTQPAVKVVTPAPSASSSSSSSSSDNSSAPASAPASSSTPTADSGFTEPIQDCPASGPPIPPNDPGDGW